MQRHECAQKNATGAGGRGYPISEQPTSNPVTPGDRPAGSRLADELRRERIRIASSKVAAVGFGAVVLGLLIGGLAHPTVGAVLQNAGGVTVIATSLVYVGHLGREIV